MGTNNHKNRALRDWLQSLEEEKRKYNLNNVYKILRQAGKEAHIKECVKQLMHDWHVPVQRLSQEQLTTHLRRSSAASSISLASGSSESGEWRILDEYEEGESLEDVSAGDGYRSDTSDFESAEKGLEEALKLSEEPFATNSRLSDNVSSVKDKSASDITSDVPCGALVEKESQPTPAIPENEEGGGRKESSDLCKGLSLTSPRKSDDDDASTNQATTANEKESHFEKCVENSTQIENFGCQSQGSASSSSARSGCEELSGFETIKESHIEADNTDHVSGQKRLDLNPVLLIPTTEDKTILDDYKQCEIIKISIENQNGVSCNSEPETDNINNQLSTSTLCCGTSVVAENNFVSSENTNSLSKEVNIGFFKDSNTGNTSGNALIDKGSLWISKEKSSKNDNPSSDEQCLKVIESPLIDSSLSDGASALPDGVPVKLCKAYKKSEKSKNAIFKKKKLKLLDKTRIKMPLLNNNSLEGEVERANNGDHLKLNISTMNLGQSTMKQRKFSEKENSMVNTWWTNYRTANSVEKASSYFYYPVENLIFDCDSWVDIPDESDVNGNASNTFESLVDQFSELVEASSAEQRSKCTESDSDDSIHSISNEIEDGKNSFPKLSSLATRSLYAYTLDAPPPLPSEPHPTLPLPTTSPPPLPSSPPPLIPSPTPLPPSLPPLPSSPPPLPPSPPPLIPSPTHIPPSLPPLPSSPPPLSPTPLPPSLPPLPSSPPPLPLSPPPLPTSLPPLPSSPPPLPPSPPPLPTSLPPLPFSPAPFTLPLSLQSLVSSVQVSSILLPSSAPKVPSPLAHQSLQRSSPPKCMVSLPTPEQPSLKSNPSSPLQIPHSPLCWPSSLTQEPPSTSCWPSSSSSKPLSPPRIPSSPPCWPSSPSSKIPSLKFNQSSPPRISSPPRLSSSPSPKSHILQENQSFLLETPSSAVCWPSSPTMEPYVTQEKKISSESLHSLTSQEPHLLQTHQSELFEPSPALYSHLNLLPSPSIQNLSSASHVNPEPKSNEQRNSKDKTDDKSNEQTHHGKPLPSQNLSKCVINRTIIENHTLKNQIKKNRLFYMKNSTLKLKHAKGPNGNNFKKLNAKLMSLKAKNMAGKYGSCDKKIRLSLSGVPSILKPRLYKIKSKYQGVKTTPNSSYDSNNKQLSMVCSKEESKISKRQEFSNNRNDDTSQTLLQPRNKECQKKNGTKSNKESLEVNTKGSNILENEKKNVIRETSPPNGSFAVVKNIIIPSIEINKLPNNEKTLLLDGNIGSPDQLCIDEKEPTYVKLEFENESSHGLNYFSSTYNTSESPSVNKTISEDKSIVAVSNVLIKDETHYEIDDEVISESNLTEESLNETIAPNVNIPDVMFPLSMSASNEEELTTLSAIEDCGSNMSSPLPDNESPTSGYLPEQKSENLCDSSVENTRFKQFVDETIPGDPIALKYIENEDNIVISFGPLDKALSNPSDKCDSSELENTIGKDSEASDHDDSSLIEDLQLSSSEEESDEEDYVRPRIINGFGEPLILHNEYRNLSSNQTNNASLTHAIVVKEEKNRTEIQSAVKKPNNEAQQRDPENIKSTIVLSSNEKPMRDVSEKAEPQKIHLFSVQHGSISFQIKSHIGKTNEELSSLESEEGILNTIKNNKKTKHVIQSDEQSNSSTTSTKIKRIKNNKEDCSATVTATKNSDSIVTDVPDSKKLKKSKKLKNGHTKKDLKKRKAVDIRGNDTVDAMIVQNSSCDENVQKLKYEGIKIKIKVPSKSNKSLKEMNTLTNLTPEFDSLVKYKKQLSEQKVRRERSKSDCGANSYEREKTYKPSGVRKRLMREMENVYSISNKTNSDHGSTPSPGCDYSVINNKHTLTILRRTNSVPEGSMGKSNQAKPKTVLDSILEGMNNSLPPPKIHSPPKTLFYPTMQSDQRQTIPVLNKNVCTATNKPNENNENVVWKPKQFSQKVPDKPQMLSASFIPSSSAGFRNSRHDLLQKTVLSYGQSKSKPETVVSVGGKEIRENKQNNPTTVTNYKSCKISDSTISKRSLNSKLGDKQTKNKPEATDKGIDRKKSREKIKKESPTNKKLKNLNISDFRQRSSMKTKPIAKQTTSSNPKTSEIVKSLKKTIENNQSSSGHEKLDSCVISHSNLANSTENKLNLKIKSSAFPKHKIDGEDSLTSFKQQNLPSMPILGLDQDYTENSASKQTINTPTSPLNSEHCKSLKQSVATVSSTSQDRCKEKPLEVSARPIIKVSIPFEIMSKELLTLLITNMFQPGSVQENSSTPVPEKKLDKTVAKEQDHITTKTEEGSNSDQKDIAFNITDKHENSKYKRKSPVNVTEKHKKRRHLKDEEDSRKSPSTLNSSPNCSKDNDKRQKYQIKSNGEKTQKRKTELNPVENPLSKKSKLVTCIERKDLFNEAPAACITSKPDASNGINSPLCKISKTQSDCKMELKEVESTHNEASVENQTINKPFPKVESTPSDPLSSTSQVTSQHLDQIRTDKPHAKTQNAKPSPERTSISSRNQLTTSKRPSLNENSNVLNIPYTSFSNLKDELRSIDVLPVKDINSLTRPVLQKSTSLMDEHIKLNNQLLSTRRLSELSEPTVASINKIPSPTSLPNSTQHLVQCPEETELSSNIQISTTVGFKQNHRRLSSETSKVSPASTNLNTKDRIRTLVDESDCVGPLTCCDSDSNNSQNGCQVQNVSSSSTRETTIRVKHSSLLTISSGEDNTESPQTIRNKRGGATNTEATWYIAPKTPQVEPQTTLLDDSVTLVQETDQEVTMEVLKTSKKKRQEFHEIFKTLLIKGKNELERLHDIIDCIELDYKFRDDVINSVKKLPSRDVIELEVVRAKKEFQSKLNERERSFCGTVAELMKHLTPMKQTCPLFFSIFYSLAEKVKTVSHENKELNEFFYKILKKWLTTNVSKDTFSLKEEDFQNNYKIICTMFNENSESPTNDLNELQNNSSDLPTSNNAAGNCGKLNNISTTSPEGILNQNLTLLNDNSGLGETTDSNRLEPVVPPSNSTPAVVGANSQNTSTFQQSSLPKSPQHFVDLQPNSVLNVGLQSSVHVTKRSSVESSMESAGTMLQDNRSLSSSNAHPSLFNHRESLNTTQPCCSPPQQSLNNINSRTQQSLSNASIQPQAVSDGYQENLSSFSINSQCYEHLTTNMNSSLTNPSSSTALNQLIEQTNTLFEDRSVQQSVDRNLSTLHSPFISVEQQSNPMFPTQRSTYTQDSPQFPQTQHQFTSLNPVFSGSINPTQTVARLQELPQQMASQFVSLSSTFINTPSTQPFQQHNNPRYQSMHIQSNQTGFIPNSGIAQSNRVVTERVQFQQSISQQNPVGLFQQPQTNTLLQVTNNQIPNHYTNGAVTQDQIQRNFSLPTHNRNFNQVTVNSNQFSSQTVPQASKAVSNQHLQYNFTSLNQPNQFGQSQSVMQQVQDGCVPTQLANTHRVNQTITQTQVSNQYPQSNLTTSKQQSQFGQMERQPIIQQMQQVPTQPRKTLVGNKSVPKRRMSRNERNLDSQLYSNPIIPNISSFPQFANADSVNAFGQMCNQNVFSTNTQEMPDFQPVLQSPNQRIQPNNQIPQNIQGRRVYKDILNSPDFSDLSTFTTADIERLQNLLGDDKAIMALINEIENGGTIRNESNFTHNVDNQQSFMRSEAELPGRIVQRGNSLEGYQNVQASRSIDDDVNNYNQSAKPKNIEPTLLPLDRRRNSSTSVVHPPVQRRIDNCDGFLLKAVLDQMEVIETKVKNAGLKLINFNYVSLTTKDLLDFLSLFKEQIKTLGLVNIWETTLDGPLQTAKGRVFSQGELKKLSNGVFEIIKSAIKKKLGLPQSDDGLTVGTRPDQVTSDGSVADLRRQILRDLHNGVNSFHELRKLAKKNEEAQQAVVDIIGLSMGNRQPSGGQVAPLTIVLDD